MLLLFARLLPGSLLARSTSLAVFILSLGFSLSGFGQLLPAWATVICANIVILSAGPILYSCFSAYCDERTATPDWSGWGMLALTIPAFYYWGLIEPNGACRSMLFSLAVVALHGRTALRLGRFALLRTGGISTRGMALLFAMLTIWMALRAVVLLVGKSSPPDLRGGNPTTWMTVFGYIIIMSLMSVCVMWMEVERLKEGQGGGGHGSCNFSEFFVYFRNKLLLLWSAVSVLIVCVVSMLGIGYVNIREMEKTRLIRSAELINDALVNHTILITGQVDSILRSVRGYYLKTHSLPESESFIHSIGFERSIIDNIYLIGSDGKIIISHDPAALGRSVADREYFQFHRATTADTLFISPVESGRVTGKLHFRITRRMNNPDGSFGGLVLAAVNPEAFARYYRDLSVGAQSSTSLLGISDRKLRARVPRTPVEKWAETVDSPLWEALKRAPTGCYENTSQFDNVRRLFVYRKVGSLPLVMVLGFSSDDLKHDVGERMRWLLLTTSAIIVSTLLLALLFTREASRRDEQDRFMSMLSHELKTPLSVLRLALGSEAMPPGVRKHAQRAVEEMNAVIQRCLQVDLLKHGRFSCSHEPLPLEAMLAQLCSASPAAERLTVKLAQLPDLTGDPQLLRIILANLMDNAFKYGSVDQEIVITAAPAQRHGRSGALLRVTNGIGPAGRPDDKRVFEKYYRAAGAHSSTGSGLGLYLAANFARLMKAELRYLSTPTDITFELWMPT